MSESTTSTCNICAENYDKKNRVKIECLYCNFDACRSCCKTYILSENVAKCMNRACGREWTRKFIRGAFSLGFISKDYKNHRENVLFDNERALLPATQILVENEIRTEQIIEEMHELDKRIQELYTLKSALSRSLYRFDNQNTVERQADAARAKFVRACPDQHCRGFLSTQWKCGICNQWTCPDCHVLKGLERDCDHTCNADDIATAQLLARDTKPCPTCGTGIFKIDGCDQMWCIECHTAFNWRTGSIENTHIHNPHYFEWMRRNNQQIVGAPEGMARCGERQLVNHNTPRTISQVLNRITTTNDEEKERLKKTNEYIFTVCRSIIHLRQVELPRFNVNRVLNNQDLRIAYMRNKISEDKFKLSIQQREKKIEKHRELRDVLQLVHDTCNDIIIRYCHEAYDKDFIFENNNTLKEIYPIVHYANECFIDIGNTYNSKVYSFDNNLRLL